MSVRNRKLALYGLLLMVLAMLTIVLARRSPPEYTTYNVNAMPEMSLKDMVNLEGEKVILTDVYIAHVDHSGTYENIILVAVADHPDAPIVAVKSYESNGPLTNSDIIEVKGTIDHIGLAYGKLYFGFKTCEITVIDVSIE